MQNLQDKTIRELTKDCRTVDDVHEMLKNLFRDTLQGILEAELEEHLGYKKHSIQGNNSGNSRNGYSKKLSKLNLVKLKLISPEIVTVNLNLELSANTKKTVTR